MISSFAAAQLQYTHTPNGEIVYGNYDTFLNDEYGGLNFFFEGSENAYEKGVYFMKGSENGIPALIRLQNENKIRVKNNLFVESVKIDADELDYYTTKTDSFFVTSKISLKDKPIYEPTILQYLGDSEKADYAMYYKLKNGYAVKKKILHLKKSEGEYWEELDLNVEDPKKIEVLFGFYDKINRLNSEQELTIEEFLNTLKIEEYYQHYKEDTRILYDKLWREIKKPELALFSGKVTKIVDSIFSVTIHDGQGQKMYELNYSSLHPLKRHDTLTVYENGAIKMKRTYNHGDLISSKRYRDEKLFLAFDYFKFEREEGKSDVMRRKGSLIGDEPINNYASISSTVEHRGQSIRYVFDKKNMEMAQKLNDIETTYLYSNYTEPINLDNLSTRLRTFFESSSGYNNSVVSTDLEGTMLLQIITDFKGRVMSYEILDSNNEALQKLIKPFCESALKSDGRFPMRFKNIRLEDKNAQCTFLLPISFEHRQFYKTFSRPNYNNWNWHWQWQQQMMWQQQQFINNSLPKF